MTLLPLVGIIDFTKLGLIFFLAVLSRSYGDFLVSNFIIFWSTHAMFWLHQVHSIFLHLRKVRKLSATTKSRSTWGNFVTWTLNWIAFFSTRIFCHVWITAKLLWDASKFPRGFEWPLALTGMVGLNVLNVLLGQGLYKALMRERSSLKRRE